MALFSALALLTQAWIIGCVRLESKVNGGSSFQGVAFDNMNEFEKGGPFGRRLGNASSPKPGSKPHDGGVILVFSNVSADQTSSKIRAALMAALPPTAELWFVSGVDDKQRCFFATAPFEGDIQFFESLTIVVAGANLNPELCQGESLVDGLNTLPKHVLERRDKESLKRQAGGVISVFSNVSAEQTSSKIKAALQAALPPEAELWFVSEVDDKQRCFCATASFKDDLSFFESLTLVVSGAKLKPKLCQGDSLADGLKLLTKHVLEGREKEMLKRLQEAKGTTINSTQRVVNVGALRNRAKEIISLGIDGEHLMAVAQKSADKPAKKKASAEKATMEKDAHGDAAVLTAGAEKPAEGQAPAETDAVESADKEKAQAKNFVKKAAAQKFAGEKVASKKAGEKWAAAEKSGVEQAARKPPEQMTPAEKAEEEEAAEKDKAVGAKPAAEPASEEKTATVKVVARKVSAKKVAEEKAKVGTAAAAASAENPAEVEAAAEKAPAERAAQEEAAIFTTASEKHASEKVTTEQAAGVKRKVVAPAQKAAGGKFAGKKAAEKSAAAEKASAEVAVEFPVEQTAAMQKAPAESTAEGEAAVLTAGAQSPTEEKAATEKAAAESVAKEKAARRKVPAEKAQASKASVEKGVRLDAVDVLERVHGILYDKVELAAQALKDFKTTWGPGEVTRRVVRYIYNSAKREDLPSMRFEEACDELVKFAMGSYEAAYGDKKWFFKLDLAPAFAAAAWELLKGQRDLRFEQVQVKTKAAFEEYLDSAMLSKDLWEASSNTFRNIAIQKKVYEALHKTYKPAFDATIMVMGPQQESERVHTFLKLWINDSMTRAWNSIADAEIVLTMSNVNRLFQHVMLSNRVWEASSKSFEDIFTLVPFGDYHILSTIQKVAKRSAKEEGSIITAAPETSLEEKAAKRKAAAEKVVEGQAAEQEVRKKAAQDDGAESAAKKPAAQRAGKVAGNPPKEQVEAEKAIVDEAAEEDAKLFSATVESPAGQKAVLKKTVREKTAKEKATVLKMAAKKVAMEKAAGKKGAAEATRANVEKGATEAIPQKPAKENVVAEQAASEDGVEEQAAIAAEAAEDKGVAEKFGKARAVAQKSAAKKAAVEGAAGETVPVTKAAWKKPAAKKVSSDVDPA